MRRRLGGPATDHIRERLAKAKDDSGLTYDAIAEAAGIDRATAHRAIAGPTDIAVETLIPLAQALGLKADELVRSAAAAAREASRSEVTSEVRASDVRAPR